MTRIAQLTFAPYLLVLRHPGGVLRKQRLKRSPSWSDSGTSQRRSRRPAMGFGERASIRF